MSLVEKPENALLLLMIMCCSSARRLAMGRSPDHPHPLRQLTRQPAEAGATARSSARVLDRAHGRAVSVPPPRSAAAPPGACPRGTLARHIRRPTRHAPADAGS